MRERQSLENLELAGSARGTPETGRLIGYVVNVAGGYGILSGLTVLSGWILNIPRLTDWFGTGISTLPNTALTAALLGLALLLLARGRTSLGFLVASLGGVLPVATLFEHITSIDLGIDTLLLAREWGQGATTSPGRIGPPAAFAFTLLSGALVSSAFRNRVPAAATATIALATAMLSLVGYLYGANLLFSVPRLTAIAVPSSVMLLALAVGAIALICRPELKDLLKSRETSAILARRLIPFLVLIPVLVGYLRIQGERAGLYDFAFGASLRTIVEVSLLLWLLYRSLGAVRWHERALRTADQELRKQSVQMAACLDTAAIAIHRIDANGLILWANQAELDMLGYAREQYVGRNISDFHKDPRTVADMLLCLKQGQRLTGVEASLRCADGTTKSVLIDSSTLPESGPTLQVQSFTRDVTAFRQAQSATARLAAIVESSDDAMVSKTLEGIITSWNRGAEKIFGYPESEAIGRHITLIVPLDRRAEEEYVLGKMRRGERIEHYETIRITKDGRLIDVSLTVSPLRNAAGEPVGASKVARDITERKRSEAALALHKLELERHKQELEEKVQERTRELVAAHERLRLADRMAAVGTLASGLAHDIKNVLLPLGIHLDSTLSAPDLPGDVAADLTVIRGLLDHLRAMSANLSLFAKDPNQEGTVGRTSLAPWRERVQGFISASLGPAVGIRWKIPDNLPDVGLAPHRLTQVVMNLVHNARDAILAKPAAEGDPARGNISVEACADGPSRVMLRVIDDGCGMDQEVADRCIEPFFTTKDRPSAHGAAGGGSGLGLSLAHAIVERAGGTLEIASAVGQGTTISLRLPLASDLPGPIALLPRVELRRQGSSVESPASEG